jgi:hypothetical protein
MEQGNFIIESASTTTLIEQNPDRISPPTSINICNASASNSATLRLFVDNGTNEVSIIENLVLPPGVTLFLTENLNYNTSTQSLQLQVAGTSPDINVMIK